MKLNPFKSNHSRQLLGKFGEDVACNYLKKHKFRILARNFKKRYGELDIVVLDGKTLVFVEVKTRIGVMYGAPQEAVTPFKLREIVKTAQFYKFLHPELPDSLRIDVIAIVLDELYNVVSFEHIKNVTL